MTAKYGNVLWQRVSKLVNPQTGRKYSQDEMIHVLGISQSAIRHMEKGTCLTLDQASIIEHVLLKAAKTPKERNKVAFELLVARSTAFCEATGERSVFTEEDFIVAVNLLAGNYHVVKE